MTTNPAHQAIYNKILKPALSKRRQSIEGYVMHVEYEKQVARVSWRDPEGGGERESANVPFPLGEGGLFGRAPEIGDKVTMAFKHGNHMKPYITAIEERATEVNFTSKKGAGIPKGMGFL
jgi:Type VI secretion system/phage-baseplate injector OB domain